jgi:hypothetical protein
MGATPKDGPSAGVGICISIISALTNIPVIGSIAQGTREILRNKRTTNAKPVILGSNYKIFLKKIIDERFI